MDNIDEIVQIIEANSVEKNFIEYGKGVFATHDAVQAMAESIVKLFSIPVVRQRFIEEVDSVQYDSFSEGCGLEDKGIQDRYEAMEHGWNVAISAAVEAIDNVV